MLLSFQALVRYSLMRMVGSSYFVNPIGSVELTGLLGVVGVFGAGLLAESPGDGVSGFLSPGLTMTTLGLGGSVGFCAPATTAKPRTRPAITSQQESRETARPGRQARS